MPINTIRLREEDTPTQRAVKRKILRSITAFTVEELAEDIGSLLDQIGLIEHKQDDKLITRLRRKYGWKL